MIASNSREACFAILFISYVLSVEVPLQDCSKGQNPETWIPVMSFLDSLHQWQRAAGILPSWDHQPLGCSVNFQK